MSDEQIREAELWPDSFHDGPAWSCWDRLTHEMVALDIDQEICIAQAEGRGYRVHLPLLPASAPVDMGSEQST